MKTKRILIVEDEHALAAAMATVCQRAGAEAVLAPSGGRALKLLDEETDGFSLMILDIGLPDMNGLDLLGKAFGNAQPLPVPVVVVTAHGNLENAIAAKKLGVTEYQLKPLDLHAFQALLERLLKPAKVIEETVAVPENETTLIGAAPAMQKVFRDTAHACATSAPVVISGPTGTGKSLVARLIHSNSDAAGRELKVIDCTRAKTFPEETSRSTLVFENIDSLDLPLQAELLQLIESSPPDLRVIATCRDNLRDAVQAGTFRDDLYYRLHVLEIRLPALRNRSEDIPALAAYFLGRAEMTRALSFSPEAMAVLKRHEWPGNVLELRNAVEYAVSICGGSLILPQHLPASVTFSRARGDSDMDAETARLVRALSDWLDTRLAPDDVTYGEILTEVESHVLRDLLSRFDNKPSRLASALKMNRTTLRRKLNE